MSIRLIGTRRLFWLLATTPDDDGNKNSHEDKRFLQGTGVRTNAF